MNRHQDNDGLTINSDSVYIRGKLHLGLQGHTNVQII